MAMTRSFYSLRVLRRQKRFAALAILSLGVTIALATTMYSVVDAILNPPSAYAEPERLLGIHYYGDRLRPIPTWEVNDLIQAALTFHQGAAGSQPEWDGIVERGKSVREARVWSTTPNYFKVLGIRAVQGRVYDEGDLRDNVPPVVVGVRLWRQVFPERRTFWPSPLMVNGEPRMVVGLLPREADYPGEESGVWQIAPPHKLRSIPLSVLRLKPGVTATEAEQQLRILDTRLRERSGATSGGDGFRMFAPTRSPLRLLRFHWAVIGAVIAVLIIACANLANIQLARGVLRARELATRAAIGASRRHLVIQLVRECSWLALGGLLLAGVLTWWGAQLINAFLPPSLGSYVTNAQLSWRVGLFAVVATLTCLGVVGVLPALRITRVDVNDVLKTGAGTGSTRRARTQYSGLVIVEMALAVAVLTATSLLAKAASQIHTFEITPVQRQLIVGLARVTRPTADDRTSRREWSDRIVQRAMAMESVVSAATSVTAKPPHHAITVYGSNGIPTSHFVPEWHYDVVSSEYLRVRGIRVRRGRDFSHGEFAQPEVIVDEETASFLWPGTDPVGKQIMLDSADRTGAWYSVIGVAENEVSVWFPTDQDTLDARARQQVGIRRAFNGSVYVLNAADSAAIGGTGQRDQPMDVFRLTVRTRDDPMRASLFLTRTMRALGNNVTIFRPETWESRSGVPRLRAKHDFIATLFVVFAVVALALSTIGVFAIVAQSVAARTREFAVRVAVGATRSDIRMLVMREGNLLSLTGIAVGLVLTIYSATFVRAFVFSDYDRYDSRWFAAAAFLLYGVAWLASYLPARRAMRINPVEALRHD